MTEEDLMQLARQAIEDGDTDWLNAKAAELAAADELAKEAAAKEAHRQAVKAAAEEAIRAEGVTLPDLGRKFDAAVAALVELARGACARNEVIRQHAPGIQTVGLVDAAPTPARELLARAVAVAASEVGTPDNGLNQLASGVGKYSGPLHRQTPVELAVR
ncbi:hypothetical protein OHT52_06305 [Streptomyces sp. NBC_00247]|uniref:hypothetical protein n=1 Tax=Streptomyces sp. NBC_00247 TaxID=2975689 RepID=UPI002E2E393C|nr:hypothetical protein [Streptomyces sp. NBC_00247]